MDKIQKVVPLSMENALLLIRKSIEMGKYQNAYGVLDDIIECHKEYVKSESED